MKKSKKILLKGMLVMLMALMSIQGVDAAQSIGYTATVNTGGQKVLVTTTTPSSNYTWALNYLTSIEGGKVVSMYYAKYATGTYKTAGSELLFLNTYDGKSAIWVPSGINTLPMVFGDNSILGECSGSRTNSVYCAISGYSYRLYHKNTSSSNTTLSGQFTLTEH